MAHAGQVQRKNDGVGERRFADRTGEPNVLERLHEALDIHGVSLDERDKNTGEDDRRPHQHGDSADHRAHPPWLWR